MSLRVAFNATPLLSPLGGIGKYIIELGRALEAEGSVDAYSFYRYRWRHERPQPPRSIGEARSRLLQRLKPWVPFRARPAFRRIGFSRGLRAYGVQLYHEQNYVPLAYDVPVVVTVHDLSWIRYPETHPIDRVRWLNRALPTALARAHTVLVDSDFVRSEVISTFAVPAERVRTVYLGVSDEFRPRPAREATATLGRLGLEYGRYVLTVGTIEPRKNLSHVLEAFSQLPAALRERYPLVVAGARGWHERAIVSRLRRLANGRQIRFLGHIASGDLPDLYAGAAVFVFASLYEGFGLPPLEAMASGVPVIVSNRASLPEVVGDAGYTVDVEHSEPLASRIAGLLDDSCTRAKLAQRGIERAERFSWHACAAATLNVYRAVAPSAV
jgi:alpha-1,3-rhamnosyl/mannosyltransferase